METSFLGDSGQDTVTVTQHYAPGTSLKGQDEAAKQVETALVDVDAVDSVQATVGSGGDMSMAAFGGASAGLKASFAVTLDEDCRRRGCRRGHPRRRRRADRAARDGGLRLRRRLGGHVRPSTSWSARATTRP